MGKKNIANLRKLSRFIIIVAVALVVVLSEGCILNRASTAVSSEDRLLLPPTNAPPNITVIAGDSEVNWAVGKNKWDGVPIEHMASFKRMMSQTSINDLPLSENGDEVYIHFDSKLPDSATLTEYILKENGNMKYNIDGMECTLKLESSGSKASFTIQPNFATSLSSNSEDYLPGNTIKGYQLVCAWEKNECEYLFVLRGDAAIAIVPADG